VIKRKNPEGKMSLSGHLKELRKRLFWSALFILGGSVFGWFIFDPVFALLQQPILEVAKNRNQIAAVNFGGVTSSFDMRLQVSIFIGVIGSSPIWLFNLWAFITPGLKKRERRFTLGFVFSAVPLFLGGCYLAWISLPAFVQTLIGFTPAGSTNLIDGSLYILFTLRILLIFGIAFVLPVVLVLLNFAGLITAKSIIKSWRLAVFLTALIAALATPTADPMSMFLLMVPLLALYFVAAGIAAIRDRARGKLVAALDAEIAAES
jgi:sec-independent protein translocase protein TatC